MRCREPGAGETAEQDRPQGFGGPSGTVEERGDRCAECCLQDPWGGDGAGDGATTKAATRYKAYGTKNRTTG